MIVTPTEQQMWNKSSSPKETTKEMTDEEINAKYQQGFQRILTENNREKLPSFAESLKKEKYLKIRPFYQRRLRWDKTKQSRLIESFLMNIPVPPIILYEEEYNYYEVMDGQQRITAIQDFYENKLKLTGLEFWPELNGRTYNKLPQTIKAGIDRRSISSIVLITESTDDPQKALELKQITFERFNTGGVDLSKQEIRNCIYTGKFNDLLLELAQNEIFVRAWDIPLNGQNELVQNNLYKKMEDVELVLRFFALRHVDNFRDGMKGFLDLYMRKSLSFSDEDLKQLQHIFNNTIELGYQIYEQSLFKPFYPQKNNSYKEYYDAVMVGLSRHLENKQILINKKESVVEETKKLIENDTARIFTGKGDGKKKTQERIKLFENMLIRIIEE